VRTGFRAGRALLALAGVSILGGTALAEEPAFDRVSFEVERVARIENDRVSAVLTAQSQGQSPATLADEVNRTMEWALGEARGASEVSAQTGTYQTHQSRDSDRQQVWVVRQDLILEADELESLRSLLGVLQERLHLTSMRFQPSDSSRRAAEDALTRAALTAFRARAELIRESLGFSGYRLVEVQVGPDAATPVPYPRGMAMAAEAAVAAPALEAGTSDVRLRVRGTIQLQ
jgi:predicted secreted protein